MKIDIDGVIFRRRFPRTGLKGVAIEDRPPVYRISVREFGFSRFGDDKQHYDFLFGLWPSLSLSVNRLGRLMRWDLRMFFIVWEVSIRKSWCKPPVLWGK